MTWKYAVWRAAPLFLVIMLVSYFAGDGWRAIPSALVAWGTILLAFMTFQLMRHSKEQEDRRREEELSKERRDRDTAWLNDIIDWAVEIAKCGLEKEFKNITVQFEKDDPRSDRFVSAFFSELQLNFEAMEGRSKYISTISLKFEESLQKAVKELIETVEEHIDLLDECKVGQPGELEKAIGNVGAHNTPLRESARKIIAKATKIKTRDIG